MADRIANLPDLDVYAIRTAIRDLRGPITQNAFARRFGFSAATVRDWEQRRRRPDGAARTLLAMIQRDHVRVEWLLRDTAVQQGAVKIVPVHVGALIRDAVEQPTDELAMALTPRPFC